MCVCVCACVRACAGGRAGRQAGRRVRERTRVPVYLLRTVGDSAAFLAKIKRALDFCKKLSFVAYCHDQKGQHIAPDAF